MKCRSWWLRALRRHALALAVLALSTPGAARQAALAQTPAGAPAGSDAAHTPGTWQVRRAIVGRRGPAATAMLAQLARAESVFRRVPPLDPPVGVTVLVSHLVEPRGAGEMLHGRLSAILVRHAARDDGTVDTGGRGEGLSFDLDANDIGCTVERSDLADGRTKFYTPVTPRQWKGLPVYGGCILLTKRPAPPTIPVTRERAMRAAMANFTEVPAVAAALRRELDGWSAAARQAPAFLDMETYTNLALGQPGARPLFAATLDTTIQLARGVPAIVALVALDPAFFDRTRPGDVQAMAVRFSCTGAHRSPWCAQSPPELFPGIRDSTDWPALMAIVR